MRLPLDLELEVKVEFAPYLGVAIENAFLLRLLLLALLLEQWSLLRRDLA